MSQGEVVYRFLAVLMFLLAEVSALEPFPAWWWGVLAIVNALSLLLNWREAGAGLRGHTVIVVQPEGSAG